MNAVVKQNLGGWKTETQVDWAVEDYSRKVLTGSVQTHDRAEFERMVDWRRQHLVMLTPVKRLARMRRWLEKSTG